MFQNDFKWGHFFRIAVDLPSPHQPIHLSPPDPQTWPVLSDRLIDVQPNQPA